MKPRDVIQFSSGPKKGMFAQVIASDGKCLTRDMDGSQYSFMPGPEETFVLIGVAALGPKLDGDLKPSPALPPPLNPADLLEPLPPDVKPVPMNEEPEKASRIKPIKPVKPKPGPYMGTKISYVFTVKNTLGDAVDVTVQVRADKKPTQYKGAAIMAAGNYIPRTDLMTCEGWRLKE